MTRSLKDRLNEIQKTIEHLAVQSSKDKLIIVEGKKDISALRELSVQARIISAKSGGKNLQDVLAVIENSNAKEVIMLLDFDRRGIELTKRLRPHLERLQIKPNVDFWCELFKLTGKEIRSIESLPAYMETLKRKTLDS